MIPQKIKSFERFADAATLVLIVALGLAMLIGLLTASGAVGQTVTPKLAQGVVAAPAYEVPKERFVVANPTQIYSDFNMTSPAVGELKTIGEPVQAVAKVQGWDWYLVGKDGVGVGYVPRSLLRPAGVPG